MSHAIAIDKLVPGGIRETDRWHIEVDDGTCSRCRLTPPEEDVPLLMWRNDGRDMLRYCERCLDPRTPARPPGSYTGEAPE